MIKMKIYILKIKIYASTKNAHALPVTVTNTPTVQSNALTIATFVPMLTLALNVMKISI